MKVEEAITFLKLLYKGEKYFNALYDIIIKGKFDQQEEESIFLSNLNYCPE